MASTINTAVVTQQEIDTVAILMTPAVDRAEGLYERKDLCPDIVLIIDDDPEVLQALRKELRKQNLTVLTSLDAREGVSLAKRHKPGVAICDIRMPELNGIEVCEAIGQVTPDTARVMLTGFSDLESVISAINLGHVNRFLCKPLDADVLQLTIAELVGVSKVRLERSKSARELSNKAAELELLNTSLEHCINERIREYEQAKLFLDMSHRERKAQYFSAIKVFSGLTELRSPQLGAHSKRVAELARLMAIELECPPNDINEIYIAGLLHDVGKIGLSDEVLFSPVGSLSKELKSELMSHCAKGQQLFIGQPDMESISTLIRHHHERFDGEGYPDGILSKVIPMGSRILAVAEDYDELQQGWLAPKKLSEEEAMSFVLKSGDTRYDPHVLAALPPAIEKLRAAPRLDERLLSGSELIVGQTLSRDFIGPDGYMWLSKEKLLSKHFIDQVKEHEAFTGKPLKVYVFRLKRSGRNAGR
ncbi:HD domain-containing phosphohydrolase [Limnobacter parvus]|uniref:Response regulator n=1 Tax=Limnobacter parvus TaxID=2939690 RepID=A0ABT1XJV9_9BURK|nr:HD domain-containing phosphohydrolase [Limnobacter parvus]MCR2746838.1 response regulator [Limnobacter parvus]